MNQALLQKLGSTVLLGGMMFGVFVLIVAPIEIVAKRRAESWPSRRGVVTLSSITLQHEAGSRSAAYYKPDICGTYADTGERFCIRRVRYGGFRWGAGKAQAQAAVDRYPVGREVDVYFSPSSPGDTVLESHSPWTEMIVLVGLGVGFLLVPVVLWVFRRRDEPVIGSAPRPIG